MRFRHTIFTIFIPEKHLSMVAVATCKVKDNFKRACTPKVEKDNSWFLPLTAIDLQDVLQIPLWEIKITNLHYQHQSPF